jgi:PKD repeat protein
MKKIEVLLKSLIVIILLIGCSDDDTEAVTGGNELEADFTFTNDGSTFQFTNQSGSGYTYRWDFGDLGFISEEENPIYTYTIGGELLVSLTITDENGNEGYISKTITAPEIIIIDIQIDGDFNDWEHVDVVAENTTGEGAIQKMKVWTVGEKVYFYLEGNADMQMALAQIYINTDDDETSGFLADDWPDLSGAEIMFEGPFENDSWGNFWAQDPGESGWSFNETVEGSSSANLDTSAIGSAGEGINAIEFSIDKSVLGDLGETLGVGITEFNDSWGGVSTFPGDGSFAVFDL